MTVLRVSLSAALVLSMVLAPWSAACAGEAAASRGEALEWLDEENCLRDGFRSHLPVAILYQDDNLRFVAPGEVLLAAQLSAATGASARFAPLWSEPAGEGRPPREKQDYSLQVPEESLEEWAAALWETPVQGDWNLLGGLYDKSLLRNYLALTIARELDIAACLGRFCEVFVQRGNGYQYQGVYLLTAPPQTAYRHLQRGNYRDGNSTPLNTYALESGHLGDGLYVPYAMDRRVRAMEQVIHQAESSIYSYDFNAFSKYGKHLDLEKMYDYFILCELFGNASSAHLSHYLYNSETERFWPVVQADFEYAVDNDQHRPMDLYDMEMTHTPYYSALVKSTDFVNGLSRRYRDLAQGPLQSSALSARIDAAVALLGEGQLRDWHRWETVYSGPDMYRLTPAEGNPAGEELPPLNRNTGSYREEINKLKFSLREHGSYMFAGISALYRQKNMAGSDAPYVRNTLLFLLFLAVVIASVRIARHRTR